MNSYKELVVWKKSMELVYKIYQSTDLFPKEELYALTNQMRRAAVSIPSNIAEGFGRRSNKEFVRFINISRGSLYELETQLEIAERLGYIAEDVVSELESLIAEISRLAYFLINSLEKYDK